MVPLESARIHPILKTYLCPFRYWDDLIVLLLLPLSHLHGPLHLLDDSCPSPSHDNAVHPITDMHVLLLDPVHLKNCSDLGAVSMSFSRVLRHAIPSQRPGTPES